MNQRTPLIAGNWKMNATHLEAIQMTQKLHYRLASEDYERVQVVVAPPFTALRSIQTVIEADHMAIRLGAQNVDYHESGAFTGEISAPMLAKLAVSFVIVGHSERRSIFDETDEIVAKKTAAVLSAEMLPIVCVGESLEQREEGATTEVLTSQLMGSLKGVGSDDVARLVIAYEPVWAIGTGRNADPDDAGETIASIRDVVTGEWGSDAGQAVRLLYGGSVNPGNITSFMAKKHIDGALVGGASLDPDTFASIVRYWA